MTVTVPENPLPTLHHAAQDDKHHLRQRAQIILMTLDDTDIDSIAEAVGLSKRTVLKWQHAWARDGLWIFPTEIWVLPDGPVEAAAGRAADVELAADSPAPPSQPDVAADPDPPTPLPPQRLEVDTDSVPGVQPEDAMWSAARKVLLFNLEHLVEWEPVAIVGEDIEGVHKMRVATRRMRSAFDVFGPFLNAKDYKYVKRQLKATARVLGDVRDLDVFLEKTDTYIAQHLDGDASSLQPLLDILHKQHRKARKRLLRWLEDDTYHEFIERFHARLLDPHTGERADLMDSGDPAAFRVDQVVPAMVYRRLEAVRAYEPHLRDADIETLHALRIEFKRLRYTLEFFAEVMGETVKDVISATKEVQDHLGDLNDASVAVSLLLEVRDDVPKGQRAGLKAYRKAREAEEAALQASFPQTWKRFNRRQLRESLAMAVAVL